MKPVLKFNCPEKWENIKVNISDDIDGYNGYTKETKNVVYYIK